MHIRTGCWYQGFLLRKVGVCGQTGGGGGTTGGGVSFGMGILQHTLSPKAPKMVMFKGNLPGPVPAGAQNGPGGGAPQNKKHALRAEREPRKRCGLWVAPKECFLQTAIVGGGPTTPTHQAFLPVRPVPLSWFALVWEE